VRYLNNAFSLAMLGAIDSATLRVRRLPLEKASALARNAVSVVGHPTTQRMLSSLLGYEVAHNRATVALGPGDELIVAQYNGPRLMPGVTELPEGARIEWFWMKVE